MRHKKVSYYEAEETYYEAKEAYYEAHYPYTANYPADPRRLHKDFSKRSLTYIYIYIYIHTYIYIYI